MNWRERLGLDGRMFRSGENPYLRLSRKDRYRLAVKVLLLIVAAIVLVSIFDRLGWHRK